MARHGRRGWRGIPTDTLGVWRNIFHAATARGSEKLESQRGQGRVHGHATPRSGQNPGRAHPLLRFEQYVERRLRSEEHTSELQSRRDLVCRLLLEKKKKR